MAYGRRCGRKRGAYPAAARLPSGILLHEACSSGTAQRAGAGGRVCGARAVGGTRRLGPVPRGMGSTRAPSPACGPRGCPSTCCCSLDLFGPSLQVILPVLHTAGRCGSVRRMATARLVACSGAAPGARAKTLHVQQAGLAGLRQLEPLQVFSHSQPAPGRPITLIPLSCRAAWPPGMCSACGPTHRPAPSSTF